MVGWGLGHSFFKSVPHNVFSCRCTSLPFSRLSLSPSLAPQPFQDEIGRARGSGAAASNILTKPTGTIALYRYHQWLNPTTRDDCRAHQAF